MTIYQPLQQYLAAQSDAAVVMSYAQIERLLGRRLPPTAYGDNKRQWWANTETHSQALAWLRANRRAKLDVNRQEVTFIRKDEHASEQQTTNPKLVLEGLTRTARRMLEDIAEEARITPEAAAVRVLDDMAMRRRADTLAWFAGKSTFSDVPSAELIREDRDAR